MLKKKWIIGLSSAATIAVVGGIIIGVCAFNQTNTPTSRKAKAIVNMDVNPSVEFVVDDKNKVISVKGLNDEGSLIIYGEALVGKDINDAIKACVKVETETGYLTANAEASQNNIKLSVTSDNDAYSASLEAKLSDSAIAECTKQHVKATVETFDKYTHESLVAKALICDSTLTKEEAEAMTNKQLAKVIALYHIDTSDIYEEKLEQYYVQVRDNDINFTEYQSVQDAIDSANSLYQLILASYGNAVTAIEAQYQSLEQITYSTFVDPNSPYQQERKKVYDAKAEVLKYRQELANTDAINIGKYNLVKSQLDAADLILDTEIAALDSYELAGRTAIASAQSAITLAVDALNSVKALFPSEIKTSLTNHSKDLEKKVNEAKNKAFKEFEKEHKEDITNAKNEVAQRKNQLKENIKNA